jgi:intein/homing endonuclease
MVRKKYNFNEKEIIKEYSSGLSSIKISEKYGCNYKTIYNLLRKNRINTHKSYLKGNKINESFFENIGEEQAYWLGFFAADGNLFKDQISIDLSIKDQEHLLLLRKMISSTHKLHSRRNTIRWHITNKKIASQLRAIGITENKTYTIKIPNIPQEQIRHLIRGYFDGDGSIHQDKRTKSPIIDFCGNRIMLDQINEFISKSLGISKKNLSEYNNIHKLRYGGGIEAKKVHSWLYSNASYYLNRKKEKEYVQ